MSDTDRTATRDRTRSERERGSDRSPLGTLTRRSFVGGLVLLAGCTELDVDIDDEDDAETPSPVSDPDGTAATGSYLTVVESSFVRGRTFDDDRIDERGRLLLRVRNDAGTRMRAVDLMPSFYDAAGRPVHVGTKAVWNLDADETWQVTVPYPGRGAEVAAFQVAGTFVLGTATTGAGSQTGSQLELVSGSDALAVDACDATVAGTVRNTGADPVRYAGALVGLYAGDDLLGTAVSHLVGLDAGAEWQFVASVPTADLAATPTDHTVEISDPWWVRGY